MALFVFTLVVVAIMVAVAIYVLRNAPLTTSYEAARDYDPADALDFVFSQLAADVRARLGKADVEKILGYEMDYMKVSGAVLNGKKQRRPPEPKVLGGPDSVAYILERAETDAVEVSPGDIHSIIQAEIAYLQSIGAIGEAVEEEDA